MVSRYIDNPLLIGNKKFDTRLYVLVTNYRPLKVWRCNKGFNRFCFEEYDNNNTDMYAHITNVAYQKKSLKYNNIHGGKWSYANLQTYVEMNHGKAKLKKMLDEVDHIILTSLKSV